MDAEVIEENDGWVGVRVTDKNKIHHKIAVEYGGEIRGHSQDGYADKGAKRTKAENEHVRQARRHARYHVFRERGHPTLDPTEIPEWQVAVASAIAQLSPDEFEAHFGGYHRQLRSAVEDGVEPVVDVPEDDVAGLRVYLLNVHLGIDTSDQLDEEQLAALTTALDTEADPDALIEAVTDQLNGIQLGPDALSITGVSDVGVLYQGSTREVEQEGDDPHPGPADARLELSPTATLGENYLSLEGFQLLVVHHLLCQARDCYLQQGLEPPESVRILGLGKYRQTVRNEHLELYPAVHATTEPVDGYSLPEIGTHLEDTPT